MARPRRSGFVTQLERRTQSRSEQATLKIAEQRAKAREERVAAARRRASAKEFAAQVRTQHAAKFQRDPPEGVRLRKRRCSGVRATEAPRKIPQSSSPPGGRTAARSATVTGGTTPTSGAIGTRSGGEHVAMPRGRKKRAAARQDLQSDRGSRRRGTPAFTGRQTQQAALQKKRKTNENPRNTERMRLALQKLKQNRQQAVLWRTQDSSGEKGNAIEPVGSTCGGIPCSQQGPQSQEGSPRARVKAPSTARGPNVLHTGENTNVRSGSGEGSDVSVSGGGSGGIVGTGVPRNEPLEEILPFIVESPKRIGLRVHDLERRCDRFSEAIDVLKAALSTLQRPYRRDEHVPSAATPLPGAGSDDNRGGRSLPRSAMQSDEGCNKGRSPPAITDPTREVLSPREAATALQASESPPPTIKPCASSLGASVGFTPKGKANDSAVPRVSAAIGRRGASPTRHSITSSALDEVPSAPVARHPLTGVAKSNVSRQARPPVAKDAALCKAVADDRYDKTGGADDGVLDAICHGVAIGAMSISSKKDEGDITTVGGGVALPTWRLNEAKEAKDTHESLVDSPARNGGNPHEGVHAEVSNMPSLNEEVSRSSSSSERGGRNKTIGVAEATSSRWQTGNIPCREGTCGKVECVARNEGDRRKAPHLRVSKTMSVCAALGVSSSTTKKEGNAAAGFEGAGSSTWRNGGALAQEDVKYCGRFMRGAAFDDEQDDDDEYDFTSMQLARSKGPWMAREIKASTDSAEHTDPLTSFDARDGEVSLDVRSGGGSGGVFDLRSRQLDRSEKAENEEEKTENGDGEGASPQVVDGGNEHSPKYPWAPVHADAIETALGLMTLGELNHRIEMHSYPEEPLVEELEGVDRLEFPPLPEPPRGNDVVIPEHVIYALLDPPDEEAMSAVRKVEGISTPDRDAVDNERWTAYDAANEYLAKRRAERGLRRSSDPPLSNRKILPRMTEFRCFQSMAEAISQVTEAVVGKDGPHQLGKKYSADPVEKLKQNRQQAVLWRTQDSSGEKGNAIEPVGSTCGGIPCSQQGPQSQEGSPRARVKAPSTARGLNVLHTGENTNVRSGSGGGSDVSVSGGGSGGVVGTGVPRNEPLEEILPFIAESPKRIGLRVHDLERRCDRFSEAIDVLKEALSTLQRPYRQDEHVPSAATPLPGAGSDDNRGGRSLPRSAMQSDEGCNKGRSPAAITDPTREVLSPREAATALQASESPPPTIKPCASSLGASVGFTPKGKANDSAVPRVSAAIGRRGASPTRHGITSSALDEVPSAPVARHPLTGVAKSNVSRQARPPVAKDAALCKAVADDRYDKTGGADDGVLDAICHGVAIGAMSISSKKDEGDITTVGGGVALPTWRLNEAKEAKDTHESLVDSPARNGGNPHEGVHAEVSNMPSLNEEVSRSSSSSERGGRNETVGVAEATSSRWQTGSVPCREGTCGKVECVARNEGDWRKAPHLRVSKTMSVCAALGVSSSTTQKKGNAAAGFEGAGSSTWRNGGALAQEDVKYCGRFMRGAALNDGQDDDNEYDFQPVQLARSKGPWMAREIKASTDSAEHTDPLTSFDARDGEVSLDVRSGGGSGGVFDLRSRQLDRSEKAENEEEKAENGDAIDVLKEALSTLQRPYRQDEHVPSAATPLPGAGSDDNRGGPSLPRSTIQSDRGQDKGRSPPAITDPTREEATTALRPSESPPPTIKSCASSFGAPVGFTPKGKASGSAVPRVSAAIGSRGVSIPGLGISLSGAVEMPSAPVVRHPLTGVAKSDVSRQAAPPVAKDAALCKAMADDRYDKTGGADDGVPNAMCHGVAIRETPISSKKDDGDTTTVGGGVALPTWRLNEAKEEKDTHESLVDSPARGGGDQPEGVPDVAALSEELSWSPWSSEKEGGIETTGVAGTASSRWQTRSVPCREGTCGKVECLARNEGNGREEPHSRVSNTMSVCAALSVSSSTTQEEGNTSADFERIDSSTWQNDNSLAQNNVYNRDRLMRAAALNDGEDDDDEYDFQPVQLARSKGPWMAREIKASTDSAEHTDPLTSFDARDGEVSLDVRSGGGSGGVFDLRSRQLDRSEKAENEEGKAENGDAIDVLKEALSTLQRPYRQDEHVPSAATPLPGAGSDDNRGGPSLPRSTIQSDRGQDKGRSPPAITDPTREEATTALRPSESPPPTIKSCASSFGAPVGFTPKGKASGSAVPRVSAAIGSRGVSIPGLGISLSGAVEMPSAPVVRHPLTGVAKSDVTRQAAPPVAKDAALCKAMADDRYDKTGGADDGVPNAMCHGVAIRETPISSKKDDGDTTTVGGGVALPTWRLNEAKEEKDTHESLVDSPTRGGGDQPEGVPDVAALSEELSWSPWSSEKEGGIETTGVAGTASSRWQTRSVPCREGTCGKVECLARNEGNGREEPHSRVSNTMSVCAALGVSSSTTQEEGNTSADFERIDSSTWQNDNSLAQNNVYNRDRLMRAAALNDGEDDDDEYDFQPVQLARSKGPWMAREIKASTDSAEHTDPLTSFDARDGEVSLDVRSGGGSGGVFDLRSRQLDRSEKAENEEGKAENGDAIDVLKEALSTLQRPYRQDEHVPSAATPLPGAGSDDNRGGPSLPRSTIQSDRGQDKGRSPPAITDPTREEATTALRPSESPPPTIKSCASSFGASVGFTPKGKASGSAVPRVSVAIGSRGVSIPGLGISLSGAVEMPSAPVVRHPLTGVAKSDVSRQAAPPVAKDAALCKAMADDRYDKTGGADDGVPNAMCHGVAIRETPISSKKDDGDTTTVGGGVALPTWRLNEAKEEKDTHESLVDSPARDGGDQREGVPDVAALSEELSWSPWSSEKEGGIETTGVAGTASSRWQTGSVPCREGTCGKVECLARNEGNGREEPHSRVSNTMSVCAALGVSSSTTQEEGNTSADFERTCSSTWQNDNSLAQNNVYNRDRLMRAAALNDGEDDDDEYDFQPVQFARSKGPWMARAISASTDSAEHTDPLTSFDARDGEVSLDVRSGGGSGGVFDLRSRQLDRSEKAENEEGKAENGDAIDVLKEALSTLQRPYRQDEHVPSAATPLPGAGSDDNRGGPSLPRSTIQSDRGQDKGRSPPAITDPAREEATTALRPSEFPPPTIKFCASSFGAPVGFTPKGKASGSAVPRVSVAIGSRGVSIPGLGISLSGAVEMPSAPVVRHPLTGVAKSDVTRQAAPPVAKDAALCKAMADDRYDKTGGADDGVPNAMCHGVAIRETPISSKKDDGDTTTVGGGVALPTWRLNEAKEEKDTHESLVDSPARDGGDQREGVPDVAALSEELSWSPWSSEKEGGIETTGVAGTASSRWQTGSVPCREGTCDKVECLARNEGNGREEPHSRVSNTMSVCAALGVSSSTTQEEGNTSADFERTCSSTWQNDNSLAQNNVYNRDRLMRAAALNDGEDDDDEYDFQPVQLARPKGPWMARAISASTDSAEHTDPLTSFDARDGEVSLDVRSGGGSGGVFDLRSRQLDRSEKAENEEGKAENEEEKTENGDGKGASPQVVDGGNEHSPKYPWAPVHADAIEKALGLMTLGELNYRIEMRSYPEEPLVEELEGVDRLEFPPLPEPPRGNDAVIPEHVIYALLDAPDEEAMSAVRKVEGISTPDRDAVDNERWTAYDAANEYLAKRRAERGPRRSSDPPLSNRKILPRMTEFRCFQSMAEAISQVTEAVLGKDGPHQLGKKYSADPVEMMPLKSTFEEDQHFIKCNVAEDIFQNLLDDTVQECKRIYRGSQH